MLLMVFPEVLQPVVVTALYHVKVVLGSKAIVASSCVLLLLKLLLKALFKSCGFLSVGG